jgi:hypothetical protein
VSAIHVHSKIPLRNDAGFVEIDIEAKDVGGMSENDRNFILTLAATFAALGAPAPAEMPEVLRGVGGRP